MPPIKGTPRAISLGKVIWFGSYFYFEKSKKKLDKTVALSNPRYRLRAHLVLVDDYFCGLWLHFSLHWRRVKAE